MKMVKVNIYVVAVVGFLLASIVSPIALAEERIFFFGNSYTYYNGGMELMVQALLEEALNTTVEAQASTQGGAALTGHLADLDGTNGDTAARQALIDGSNTNWDLVVLQDQSAIPAFVNSDIWFDSQEAGVELNNLIEPTGAVTMFLLTWGRQSGLENEDLFPDFPTMQQGLNSGYRLYRKEANNPQSFVAPAGIAYQLIYDNTISAGGTVTSSPFSDLYSGDGSHPSVQGSYLAACVIFAAYTGLSVAELEWVPEGIDAERRDYLQNIADEAVFVDNTFSPSRFDLSDFVSPGDKLEPTAMPTTASPTASPSLPIVQGQTAQIETCYEELDKNDVDGDAKLDRSEYANFLIAMSGGAVDVANDPDVATSLLQVYLSRESDASSMFIYGAARQEDALPEELTFLDSFCADLYTELYSFFEINVKSSDCTNSVFIADAGWDNYLARANYEYLVFIIEIGERSFDPIIAFNAYNSRFDIVFYDFATDGRIFIGAGQDEEFINQLCQQTAFAMAVSAFERGSSGVDNPADVVSNEYSECFGALAVADSNQDEKLNKLEYVAYVNDISGGNWDGLSYLELPPTLRTNFEVFVTSGLIDLTGLAFATAGTLASGDDLTQLETFCPTTYDAILVALGEVPSTLTPSSVPISPTSSAQTSAPSTPSLDSTVVTTSTPSLLSSSPPSLLPSSPPSLLSSSAPSLLPSSSPTLSITTNPTTSPTASPSTSPTPAPTISAADFQQCKISMIISDLNRDNHIDSTEYMGMLNRMTSNAFGTVAYEDLEPVLRNNFVNLEQGKEYLDITGSKPGETLTNQQLISLHEICRETLKAIDRYNNPVPTVAPAAFFATSVPAPTTQSPTAFEPPTISDSFFRSCRSAMVVSDLSGDDNLEPIEYVRFLNRLTSNEFAGLVFDELVPVLENNYYNLRGTNIFMSVAGSKSGQIPSNDQTNHLYQICTDTNAAISLYYNPPTTPGVSNAPPAPTPQRCTDAMVLSDLDLDGNLNQLEYIRFLNRLENNRFLGFKFSQLSPGLQNNYNNLVEENGLLDVAGIKPGVAPSAEQSESLRLTCAASFEAIDRFYNPVPTAPPTTEGETLLAQCKTSMALADTTVDESLDEDEYVAFLNSFSENKWENAIFSELPYVLQDNFEWILFGSDAVDITGAGEEQSPTVEQELYLEWICNKTDLAIEIALSAGSAGDESPILFSQQCLASMATSDIDGDDFLSKNEFVLFVNNLVGMAWDGYDHDSLGVSLRVFFENNSDLRSGGLNVEGSKPGANSSVGIQNYLDSICESAEQAIDETRLGSVLFEKCRISLTTLDQNGDTLLSQEEYVPFAYNFADADSTGINFSDLDQILQDNYQRIKASSDSVDIFGSYPAQSLSPTELRNLRFICTSTATAAAAVLVSPTPAPTEAPDTSQTTVVYNSFIISNDVGLMAFDLQSGGLDRRGLDKAYGLFVISAVKDLGNKNARLRGRRLEVIGVGSDSPIIYQFEDVDCPLKVQGTDTVCQVVFASFDLRYVDENDPDSLSASFSAAIQAKIDSGLLQLELSESDVDNVLRIVSATEPLRQESSETAPASAPKGDEEEDDGMHKSALIIGAAVGGGCLVLALIAGIWLCCDGTRRRNSTTKPTSGGSYEKEDYSELLNVPDHSLKKNRIGLGAFVVSEKLNEEKLIADDDFFGNTAQEASPLIGKKKDDKYPSSNDVEDQAGDVVYTSGSDSESEHEAQEVFYDADEPVADFLGPHFIVESNIPDPEDAESENESIEAKEVSIEAQRETIDDEQEALYDADAPVDAFTGANLIIESNKFDLEDAEFEEVTIEGEDEDDTIGDDDDDDERSMTSEENRVHQQYRAQLVAIVLQVIPDEIDNVDTMMEQFAGREEELLSTLQNMAGGDDDDDESSDEESGEEEYEEEVLQDDVGEDDDNDEVKTEDEIEEEEKEPKHEDDPEYDDAEVVVEDEDAELQVVDAEVQVEDAEVQVEDANVQVEDANVQVENAEVQVEDAEVQVEDAEVQVKEAEVQVEDVRVEVEDEPQDLDEPEGEDVEVQVKDEDKPQNEDVPENKVEYEDETEYEDLTEYEDDPEDEYVPVTESKVEAEVKEESESEGDTVTVAESKVKEESESGEEESGTAEEKTESEDEAVALAESKAEAEEESGSENEESESEDEAMAESKVEEESESGEDESETEEDESESGEKESESGEEESESGEEESESGEEESESGEDESEPGEEESESEEDESDSAKEESESEEEESESEEDESESEEEESESEEDESDSDDETV